ncbi:mechanosensitive ion channel family protein [Acidisoma silvae]|uniref:Mechanosensitive ion channel n=1 Tax=Acidisoma silvae TaxID=2802396 RepID=A0A964DZC4_9PROT|nr:mechanosensitive ion channel domain-containing protein [Acidisoma silvae]MCB8875972.1 mechanosensitive ion channel [Acidisoma silvae]
MRLVPSTILIAVFTLMAAAMPIRPAAAQGNAAPAPAQVPAGLSAADAHQLLSVLQSPQQRSQLVKTLQGLEKVLPATAPPLAADSTAKPAASTPAAAAAPAKATVALKPNSLGADLIDQADSILTELDNSVIVTLTKITQYRAVGDWVKETVQDPIILQIILSAVWRLALVLLVAFACEFGVWHFTAPLYKRLGRNSKTAEARAKQEMAAAGAPTVDSVVTAEDDVPEGAEGTEAESQARAIAAREAALPVISDAEAAAEPALAEPAVPAVSSRPNGRFTRLRPLQGGWPLLRRLPYILGAMAVDALPPIAFLAVATLLLASPLVSDILMRLMIEAVVNAYVLCRLLLVAARGTFCAPSNKLRLLHISDESAAFLAIWCRRIALVIVLGFAVVQVGGLSGMEHRVQHGIGRVFGLIIHLMLVVMVLKRRREVESWLRGVPGEKHTFWHNMKARLASVWHWQAIIVIMLGWIVFATEFMNHVQHPTRIILGTLAILVVFRVLHIVLLGGLEKIFAVGNDFSDPRRVLLAKRAARYHLPLRMVINLVMILALLFVLGQFWGLNILQWLRVGDLGTRLFSSLGTIVATLVVAVVIWETLNYVMQIYMDELSQQGSYVRAARIKTVVPILRNTVLITLLVVFALTVLSEIGVNIAPLLAGASIIGVALGFGSQKLVQDFINGIFLLLENAMQVGDWVTAGGLSGTVENLSIRTLRLRASDGSVHIIPFSSVTTVTNTNRGLGNAAVSVTLSYEEDTDKAGELLKQIVLDLRAEEAFSAGMLSDLQYWGVDKIDGTTATLAGQVVCTDKTRWSVQRELNRRIKLAFQDAGIRIMPPATVTAFQHPLAVQVEMLERPLPERPVPQPAIEPPAVTAGPPPQGT